MIQHSGDDDDNLIDAIDFVATVVVNRFGTVRRQPNIPLQRRPYSPQARSDQRVQNPRPVECR